MSNLTREKMFSSVLWATVGRLLSMVGNFVASLVLARAITPADYGIYFVGLTTVLIVAGVGALGMDQVVVRFSTMPIARESNTVLSHVVGLCLGIVTAAALVVCTAFLWLGPVSFRSVLAMPGLAAYTGMLAAWVFFAVLQRQLAESFRGLNDIRMATLSGGMRNGGILNAAIVCIATLALWVLGRLTLYTALLTMVVACAAVVVFAAIVLWMRLRRRIGHQLSTPTPTPILSARMALHEGWPLGLSGFIVILNNMGSMWLASPLDTAAHVALFGVALRLVFLLVAPMMVTNAILPPIIAELYSTGQLQRLERVIKSIGGLVLLPSLILLTILIFAGRPILGLMFGSYYQSAYPLLILICVGQIINIATGAWQIVLPMTGSKHQLLTSSVIAVVTQLVLGLVLGYRMGVTGVAIGFCSSVIITNMAGMWFVHRKLGFWTYASLNWRTLREAIDMVRARLIRRVAWQNP